MINDLEKYKNSLPIIKLNNTFLDVTLVPMKELEKYINHKIWIRKRNFDNCVTENIETLIGIDKNEIIFSDYTMNYVDLIGIEDLDVNYNDGKIDFSKFIGKKVRITNKYDSFIDCAIQYVDDELIWFAVRLENYDSLSYDLTYPLNLIRKIEII